MRSDAIKNGFERAPHRSLLRACGLKDNDFGKPFIGICNSCIDIIPGHVHLHTFGNILKDEIRASGGIPFEFNTIGICDGIAMGHYGMKFSLPSRELIADSLETMAQAHRFDGLVCMPNCDKIVPGMIMGALRVNIPTLFVSGGPMAAGRLSAGETADRITLVEAVGAYKAGRITEDEFQELEKKACPTVGSCSGLYTANSMNCLLEAVGLAFPGNGTHLAVSEKRKELVRKAAAGIMNLIQADLKPKDIVTREAIDNAFVLDMAMGGSSNTILHPLAIAHEAGIEYSLERINQFAMKVPHLCKVSPASRYHMEDVDEAGGVSAILKEAGKTGLLNLKERTVTLKKLGQNIA